MMLALSFALTLFAGCAAEEEHEDVCDACTDDAAHEACHEASEECEDLEGDEHETCEDEAAALCE